jgi:DNA-binding protein H-NS
MATLASIKKQIAELQKKAEALVKAESKDAIAKVKALIDRYQLTAEDLGLVASSASGRADKAAKPAKAARAGARKGGARKKAAAKSVGVAMYQDPKSGKTWTGRGKPPNWLAGVKDRSAFLIGASEAAAAPTAATPQKTRRAKKAKAAVAAAPAKASRKLNGSKPAKATRAAKPAASKRVSKKAAKSNPAPVEASADVGQAASSAAG